MAFKGMKPSEEAARCLLCENAPCTAACPEGCNPARAVRAVNFENERGAGYLGVPNCYKEAKILENVNKVGKVLGELLEDIKSKHSCVGDVRYIGLFSSIELVKNKDTKEPLAPYGKDLEGKMGKIIGALKAKGFLTYSHENMIFVSPPLIITEAQLREEMAKVDEVLATVDAEI